MPGIFVYLGIGFLVLAISHGANIDWSSAWTWAILLAWPFALIFYIFTFIGAIFVWIIAMIIVIGIAVYIWRRIQENWRKMWSRP